MRCAGCGLNEEAQVQSVSGFEEEGSNHMGATPTPRRAPRTSAGPGGRSTQSPSDSHSVLVRSFSYFDRTGRVMSKVAEKTGVKKMY